MRPTHSHRLERWLGADRVETLSAQMRGWYGPPITLLDVPGVQVHGDGDFSGRFERGFFASARDVLSELGRRWRNDVRFQPGVLPTGFASISDALQKLSGGKRVMFGGGGLYKVGTTGVVAATNSLFRVGSQPAAGSAASAAPGGTVPTSATTGALAFSNPGGTDTTHLIGADIAASVVNNSLLLYDRIFAVAKTMNSTATEAVTGVPSRYQSTTAGAADYIGGNFLFMETGTALAATAHNWTVCTYTDQANNSSTLPSIAGNSGTIINRLDMPISTWFAPLETGDVGVKALTQMQCSAAVATGAIDFVIGHPLGVMAMPIANLITPFDWLTSRDLVPRIFDAACLALLELCKSATTATTYSGFIWGGQG
jgi:hypothetical protein